MNKEELLKAIEQKRQAIQPTDTSKMKTGTVPNKIYYLEQGWLNALKWMEDLINSIPTVPSEDLDIDEELQRFFESKHLFVDADDLLTVRHCGGSPADKIYYFEEVARHFAQLQKEQMMQGFCYETKLYRDEEGDGIDTPIESWLALENNEITNLPNIGLKDGDNVKVIIVKDEQLNYKVNIEPPSFEESQGEFNSYNVALNG